MRTRRRCALVSLVLALVLGFSGPGPSSMAFEPDSDLRAGLAGATTSDDDNIGKQVMLGVFIAVVLVLFYLGLKADRDFGAEVAPGVKLAAGGSELGLEFRF